MICVSCAVFVCLIIGFACGQETTSDGCYQAWTGYRVHCLEPYERRPFSSEEECKDLCTSQYPTCQSLQFNAQIHTCDLFMSFILPSELQQISYYSSRSKRQISTTEIFLSGPVDGQRFMRFEAIPRLPASTRAPLPLDALSSKVRRRFAAANGSSYGPPTASPYGAPPPGFIPAYSSMDTAFKITSYQAPRPHGGCCGGGSSSHHPNTGYPVQSGSSYGSNGPSSYPAQNNDYPAQNTNNHGQSGSGYGPSEPSGYPPQNSNYPTHTGYESSTTPSYPAANSGYYPTQSASRHGPSAPAYPSAAPAYSHDQSGYSAPKNSYPPQPKYYHAHKKTINADPDQCGRLGARVTLANGYSYLRPTGPCTTASPTTTPSPIRDCPEGEVADYIVVTNVSVRYTNAVRIPAVNPTDCLDACTNNSQFVSPQRCMSAVYDRLRQDCLLSPDETLPPSGTSVPISGTGNAYYEKICVDETTARICPGPHRRDIQMTLNGFADLIVNAISFNDCLYQCINSVALYATVCNSGVYYYDVVDLNCVINRETANSQPGFLQTDDENAVDYFQIGCRLRTRRTEGRSRGTISAPRRPLVQQFLAVPRIDINVATRFGNLDLGSRGTDAWGAWNGCGAFQDAHRSYRFRNCDRPLITLDNTDCEWESKLCRKVNEDDKLLL